MQHGHLSAERAQGSMHRRQRPTSNGLFAVFPFLLFLFLLLTPFEFTHLGDALLIRAQAALPPRPDRRAQLALEVLGHAQELEDQLADRLAVERLDVELALLRVR